LANNSVFIVSFTVFWDFTYQLQNASFCQPSYHLNNEVSVHIVKRKKNYFN